MTVDTLIQELTLLSKQGYGDLPVTTPDMESGTAMDLCPPILIERDGINLLDTRRAISLDISP